MTDDKRGRLPNFLIVGAAKAGTTTLYHWLRAHPEVFVSTTKEIHFFDRHFARGREWYESQFIGAGSALAVGEATPYMSDLAVGGRMANTVPDANLIALLRNPIDRAYSHYWHVVGHRAEHRSFAEAVASEARGESGVTSYVAESRYLPQLQELANHFARDKVLVMLFDDLTGDPQGSFRKISEHIGIDAATVPGNVGARYNASRRYRSVRLRRLQRKYQGRLHIPPRVGALVDKLNSTDVDYPEMTPDLRSDLRVSFAAHNEALGEWIGRDLSGWS